MQYLDALEGLRSQGFPDEPITTRRYEILHRFMDGVSDPVLQRELTVVFATEAYLADPPTVESLRFTVLPKEWYTEGEASTCTAYTPVPVHANIDGVDMKFDASVVVDVFPQGVCLGPHELRCYSISKQEPTGEARIDERASLVVPFAVQNANPIPLRGMVDTGFNHEFLSLQPCSLADRCSATTLSNRLVCC